MPRDVRINPLTIPDDEAPEDTLRRLAPLARADLQASADAAQARGTPLLATATDGSLGTGHVWPSSDLDLTLVPQVPARSLARNIEWDVRAGLVVHRHLTTWDTLTCLRDNYPQTFIDTAAGDWVRDPTWMLDGLATLAPVHDPEGVLRELRQFVRDRRFAPEVVLPRRRLLLRRVEALKNEAAARFESGDEPGAALRVEWAQDVLSMVWTEADSRLISHKESDPELAAACAALGCPEAHALFRAAAGLTGEASPDAVRAAARQSLGVFSRWLEGALDASPENPPALEDFLPRLVYLRHRLWAASLAPARGCWLLLASDRTFFRAVVTEVAAAMTAAPQQRESQDSGAAFADAVVGFADALPLAPFSRRWAALSALTTLTEAHFGCAAAQ